MTAGLRRIAGTMAVAAMLYAGMVQAAAGASGDRAVKSRVYIDTDTANEVDDPYAVFRALVAPEISVVGLSSMSWKDKREFIAGTRESQAMNEEILTLMGQLERVPHPLGAHQPLPDRATPVDSPAARDIIAKAQETPAGQKLHVFVLGAYTNVASALLLEPAIKDRIAVYAMGYNFDGKQLQTDEFNCQGDLHAAAYLPASGVELHIMPASTLLGFRWTKVDVDRRFKGKGGLPDYLVRRWETWAPDSDHRILWDIAIFEAFLRPDLARSVEIVHERNTIRVWTSVDEKAMQADYWAATVP